MIISKRICFVCLVLLAFFNVCFAQTKFQLSVPFYNFNLNTGQSLEAVYAFGPHKIILCYENNLQYVGVMVWPYGGVPQSSTLEVQLKTDPQFQGEFADPTGTIEIFNNQSRVLVVSCVYGF